MMDTFVGRFTPPRASLPYVDDVSDVAGPLAGKSPSAETDIVHVGWKTIERLPLGEFGM